MGEADINLNELMKPQEKKNIESALFDVFKDMTDIKKVNLLTQLNDNQVKIITKLMMLSDMRNKKMYEKICNMFMLLQVSSGRQSRTELLQGIKNANPEGQNQNASNMDKFRQLLS